MRNLLSAGFTRLWRSKAFWLSCMFLAGQVCLALWTDFMDHKQLGIVRSIDSCIFQFAMFLGLLMAVLCSLHLGTEYSDGTLRNKLIVGCKRRDIYVTNLIVLSTAAIVMCLSAIIPGLCMGVPLLGWFQMGTMKALVMMIGCLVLALCVTAILTLLSTLVTTRAVSAIVSLLMMLALMAVGVYSDSRLQAEPTITGMVITTTDEAGNIDWGNSVIQETPNPLYLPDGPVRDIYEFIHDFTPGGQMMQYASLSAQRPEMLIQYDAVIVIITTAIGIYLFKRKDLR